MADDNRSNVIVFLRRDRAGHELVCAVNFSPEAWEDYRFGVPGASGIMKRCSTPTASSGAAPVCAMRGC